MKSTALWLVVAAAAWLWSSLFPQSVKLRALNTAILVALCCAVIFIPSNLSVRWKIICFATFAGVLVLAMFSPGVNGYIPYLIGVAGIGSIAPRSRQEMTMREAWNYLRNSEASHRERAKAIIVEHLRATSRPPVGPN